jgi:hypothetical protein
MVPQPFPHGPPRRWRRVLDPEPVPRQGWRAPVGGMATTEHLSPTRQCCVPWVIGRQAHAFLLRSLAEPGREKHIHFAGRSPQQIPTIFIPLPDDHFNPGLAQASVTLSLGSGRIGAPILMHDPRGGRDMVAGYDEASGCQRKLRQEHKDEPLMLGRRDQLSAPPEKPRGSAARVRGSLDLYLDRRSMSKVRSNSQYVCSCDAVTSESPGPVVSGQSRARPVLPDSLRHLPVHHGASIAQGSCSGHRSAVGACRLFVVLIVVVALCWVLADEDLSWTARPDPRRLAQRPPAPTQPARGGGPGRRRTAAAASGTPTLPGGG